MAEPARRASFTPYDQDFAAWSEEQGRSLRARAIQNLDWENLAEEIETLGRSERSEIRSRLAVLLLHLLKWHYQPERRKNGWRASIVEARGQINEQLEASPSLRTYPGRALAKAYVIARLRAADETGMPLDSFPRSCPYAVPDVLEDTFYPGPSD